MTNEYNGPDSGAAPDADGWRPLPQGDYDSDATAFVQLPPDGFPDAPLAAPGHGYVPPQITVSPATGAAATDPAATGVWALPPDLTGPTEDFTEDYPGAYPGNSGPVPHAPHGSHEANGPHGSHGPAVTGWPAAYEEPPHPEPPHSVPGAQSYATAPGETGQWFIPVAGGELPEESGEFTTSSLAAQWGDRTPPATLPGGAPAPWASEPWAQAAPQADHETGSEAGPEAGPEGGPQAGPQAGVPEPVAVPVPVAEPEPEPEPVPAPEPPVEVAPEVGVEAEPEPAPEADPVAESESPTSEHESDRPEREPEPAAAPEPEPEPAEDSAPVSVLEPEAGLESAPVSEPAPVLESDPAPESVGEAAPESQETEDAPAGTPVPLHDDHPMASYVLRVNGTDRPVTDAWIGESLLYVLRERLGLAGAKDGCSQGECGACNVQVDGRLVASCLVPAATTAGSEVRTVEGLAADGHGSDVQRALAACGAVQCGFCVPGMAMTVHDLLEGNPNPTDLEARQALCGNLCRCSGYRGVLDAVRQVADERRASADAADAVHQGEAAGTTGDGHPRIPHQAGPVASEDIRGDHEGHDAHDGYDGHDGHNGYDGHDGHNGYDGHDGYDGYEGQDSRDTRDGGRA